MMTRKRKKTIYEYTREDADFFTSDIRSFSLEPPIILDEAVAKLREMLKHPEEEPGLTALEFILRRLEKEAKAILISHGYSTDLDELWSLEDENTYLVKTEGGGTALKCDVDIQSLSAKKVLFSALHLRDDIANGKAEEAAIEMMKLLYAAISADMYDVIMTGARAKVGQKKGGRAPTKKLGILLAINKSLKALEEKGYRISRERLWRYFKENHDIDKERKPIEIKNYRVFFSDNRLIQETDSGNKIKVASIGEDAFLKYVTYVKRMRKKQGSK